MACPFAWWLMEGPRAPTARQICTEEDGRGERNTGGRTWRSSGRLPAQQPA